MPPVSATYRGPPSGVHVMDTLLWVFRSLVPKAKQKEPLGTHSVLALHWMIQFLTKSFLTSNRIPGTIGQTVTVPVEWGAPRSANERVRARSRDLRGERGDRAPSTKL